MKRWCLWAAAIALFLAAPALAAVSSGKPSKAVSQPAQSLKEKADERLKTTIEGTSENQETRQESDREKRLSPVERERLERQGEDIGNPSNINTVP